MENLREPSADSNGTYLKKSARGKVSALATVTTTAAAQSATTTNNGKARTDTAAVTQDSCGQLNWLQHLNSNNNNNNSTNASTTGKEKCGQVNAVEATKWGGVEGGSAQWPSAQNSWHCVSCKSTGAAVVMDEGVAAALQHKHNTVAAATTTTTVGSQPTAALAVALVNMEDRAAPAVGAGEAGINGQTAEQTQSAVRQNGATISQPTSAAAAIPTPAVSTSNAYDVYEAIGAASLSPPGASGQSHSQRSNSPHNSTDNLSYSSDNFYPDNLILLEDDDDDIGHGDLVDDDDVEAEEISLNSDDCVYAYRGDGADFDLALDAIAGRGAGDMGLLDDETDFLEMDFEPDPLSEVEYGSVEAAPAHADAFLLQRDSCHLSGRHSATLSLHACTPTQRQLFSSPIDDDLPPPPPAKGLQSQLLMSKNFARISMHLDQIKGENGDCDIFERAHSDRASVLGMLSGDASAEVAVTSTTTAHSLPNALLTSFGRDMRHVEETTSTPSKVTGAKPKRLSTFSTSSSTSSKNSSKSRQSLRSSYATAALCNSSSFDERSVSCTEFRCVPPASTVEDCLPPPAIVTNSSNGNNNEDFSANDETCLDCLEKEFLANTIGKAIDLSECPKCRKRSSGMALYKRVVHAATTRCRSGSPAFFGETRDDCLFEAAASDFLGARKTDEWTTPIKDRTLEEGGGSSVSAGSGNGCVGAASSSSGAKAKSKLRARARSRTCDVADVLQLQAAAGDEVISQRSTTCDNLNSEQLLKNLLLTEKEVVTISTLNISEETLVQALDKLNVSYNAELVKSHFKTHYMQGSNCNANTGTCSAAYVHRNLKEYKDLKHFLLHESKKNCNYPKLKRLIEVATRQQLDVQYKQDANNAIPEMVPVKVADILHQWVRTKKLDVLKELDKRFVDANILGKIANIIRQAQQRCTPRRPLPEYISIPQYYASGYLTLTKKC